MGISVPFVPTPTEVVREMLRIAELKPGEIVVDLGCGDGRVLTVAAKEFDAFAVGVEARRDLIVRALVNVKKANVLGRVLIIQGDFFKLNLGFADVVFLYLLSSVNEMLKPKLEKELKDNARVVSHDFEVRGWRPTKEIKVRNGYRSHTVYLYRISDVRGEAH